MVIHIELKKRIMMKVYMIYTIKRLREPFAAELLLLVVSLSLLFFFVSVPHVIANTPLSFYGFSHFVFIAIRNTEFIVQAILLALAVAGAILIRNFVSLYKRSSQRSFQANS